MTHGSAPPVDGNPLISVVIPAYNVAAHIGGTLDSVFAQEYRNFEVLVVNDGSPDTPALEEAIAAYRSRITYLTQANAGPSAARNAAIARACGEWIAFLDGDDRWLPHCLADQVARATADRELAVVHGDAEIIGDPRYADKTLRQLNASEEQATFVRLVAAKVTITTSCAMVRRDACVAAGMFDAALRRSEDFDLWLRIAHAGGRFHGTHRVLGQYRRDGTGASTDLIAMSDGKVAVLDKCERTMTLSDEERDAIAVARRREMAVRHLLVGKRAFASGDFRTAQSALREANAVMHSAKLWLVVQGLNIAPQIVSRLYRLAAARRG